MGRQLVVVGPAKTVRPQPFDRNEIVATVERFATSACVAGQAVWRRDVVVVVGDVCARRACHGDGGRPPVAARTVVTATLVPHGDAASLRCRATT